MENEIQKSVDCGQSTMDLKTYLLKKRTEQTTKVYLFEIEKYIEKNPKAKEYIYKEILVFITSLREKYKNTNTINRILQSIKKYYDYLVEIQYRKDNPSRNIKLRDNKTRYIQLQDLLNNEELESLFLNYRCRYKRTEKRDKIIISLLIYQALRIEEITKIELNDIDLNKGEILIKSTVKSNQRTLKLQSNQILLFNEYIKENENKQDCFLIKMKADDITKFIKRHFRNAIKDKNINAKKIRQSVIKNLLEKGNDIRMVQYFAGHKEADSTEKYKQTQVNTLQENINKYHTIQ